MLIKPWTEVQNPRHVLEDEGSDDSPDLIPEILITCSESADTLMICPMTTKILIDAIPDKSPCGSISIRYPDIEKLMNKKPVDHGDHEDYDEDEQLYSAMTEQSLKHRFTELDIPIYHHQTNHLMIIVPHITNSIAINMLGNALVEFFNDQIAHWVTISPCPLNNNETVNKFIIAESNDIIDAIPHIKPPHFITGISGAINSNLYVRKNPSNLVSLILNAEGQPGFEKLDNDSIIDASHIISELLTINTPEKYHKAVSLSARKFNGYSNSGMYI